MSHHFTRRVGILTAGLAAATGLALTPPTASGQPADDDRAGATASQQVGQTREARSADRLTSQLGSRTAGSYFNSAGELVVTVLDSSAAEQVRESGANARIVSRSEAELQSIVTSLGKHSVANTSTGVDTSTNQVVVSIGSDVPARDAAALRSAAKRYGGAVRVESDAGNLTPYLRGGDALYTGAGGRCSAGFNVTGGYVLTAGHCTEGLPYWYVNTGGSPLGPSLDSSFPGDDFGVIRNDGGVSQPGVVYLWNGTNRDITGAANAVVGQSVCKSGSTTRLTCGTVTRRNVTVNYGGGDIVSGLTESNACSNRGDSGGSWFAGNTALGLMSGGNLICGAGTQSFFQPVVEALNAYGVWVY